MTPLLAETTAANFSPAQLGAFLGIVLFILSLIIGFKKAFGHEPPLHKAYASKDDHDKLVAKMEDEFKRERLSRKGLYEKVEEQGRDIASLQTETEKQTEDLADLKAEMKDTQNRIDLVPERTIKLLRETKGLI